MSNKVKMKSYDKGDLNSFDFYNLNNTLKTKEIVYTIH